MASGWRSIIKEAEFEEQLAALIPFEPWRDSYLAPAEELLAREPSAGVFISGDIWKLALPPLRDDRAVEVFYTFDDEIVVLLWIVAYE